MSNTERQRRFRERHPGYYGRLHRKRRAPIKAMMAQLWAEARAQAQAQASLAAVKPAPPVTLMLPAPVLDPLASEIAALAESLNARSAAACALKIETAPPAHPQHPPPLDPNRHAPRALAEVGRLWFGRADTL